jgi:hypothetical protein
MTNNKNTGWTNPDFISETEKNHKEFFNKNITMFRELGDTPKEVNGKTLTDSEVVDYLVDTSRINLSVYRDLLTIVSGIIDNGDDIVLDTLREIHGLKYPNLDKLVSDTNYSLYGWVVYLFEIQNIMNECLNQFYNPIDVNHYRYILTNIHNTISTIGKTILSNYSPNDDKCVEFYRNLLKYLSMDDVITLKDTHLDELQNDYTMMKYVHGIVQKMKDEPTVSLYMVLSHYNKDIYNHFKDVLDKYSPDNHENFHFHQFCWEYIYNTIPGLHHQMSVHIRSNMGLDIVGMFQVKTDQLLKGDMNLSRQLDVIRYDKSIVDRENNHLLSSFMDMIDNSSDEELMEMGLVRK